MLIAPSARLEATLLPSPMKAMVVSASSPWHSWMVMRSARAWVGCSWSDSALMTGTDAYRASSSRPLWAPVRQARPPPWTHRERDRATSAMVSRTPSPTSACCSVVEWPPRCDMATSRQTRVRRDGRSKRSTSVFPVRRVGGAPALRSRARPTRALTSCGARSVMESRSSLRRDTFIADEYSTVVRAVLRTAEL